MNLLTDIIPKFENKVDRSFYFIYSKTSSILSKFNYRSSNFYSPSSTIIYLNHTLILRRISLRFISIRFRRYRSPINTDNPRRYSKPRALEDLSKGKGEEEEEEDSCSSTSLAGAFQDPFSFWSLVENFQGNAKFEGRVSI